MGKKGSGRDWITKNGTIFRWSLVEATTGFEPVIRVLQTHALPLGYVALAPCVGLEPTTPRLTAACSTD